MARTRGYQRDPRFTKRLEVRFGSGGLNFTGILSNLSESGLFIRTNRGFAPETLIDIELVMPGGKISFLKGLVKWTVKTPISTLKNGMGIELIKKDPAYMDFVKSFTDRTETDDEKPLPPDFQIISCPKCGIRNKVSSAKLSLGPKCGRCGTSLTINTP